MHKIDITLNPICKLIKWVGGLYEFYLETVKTLLLIFIPAFVLENFRGLVRCKFSEPFQNIIAEIRSMTITNDGRSRYLVSYRLVCKCDWRMPHNRQKVYIAGLRSDVTDSMAPFPRPRRPITQTPSDRLFGDARPMITATRSATPSIQPYTLTQLQRYLESLRVKGAHPRRKKTNKP